jgi:hypothetical protein
MLLLWQNKSLRLPGFSALAEQVIVGTTDLSIEPHSSSNNLDRH